MKKSPFFLFVTDFSELKIDTETIRPQKGCGLVFYHLSFRPEVWRFRVSAINTFAHFSVKFQSSF